MKRTMNNRNKTNYTPVERNIYKTGNRYRVRVGDHSMYCTSLTEARRQKKLLTMTPNV